jgi:hypothetical protein
MVEHLALCFIFRAYITAWRMAILTQACKFFSVLPGKCQDSTSNQTTAASFCVMTLGVEPLLSNLLKHFHVFADKVHYHVHKIPVLDPNSDSRYVFITRFSKIEQCSQVVMTPVLYLRGTRLKCTPRDRLSSVMFVVVYCAYRLHGLFLSPEDGSSMFL